MTCKDCIYYAMCINCNGYDDLTGQSVTFDMLEEQNENETGCKNFKNKAHFVELPCGLEEWIYVIENKKVVRRRFNKLRIKQIIYGLNNKRWGEKQYFLTREDAEFAIKELSRDEL